MTGMAGLSAAIAAFSFTLKLPQAFLDGQNSLSVLAAGLTAPDGARNLFSQGLPEDVESQSQQEQETGSVQSTHQEKASSSSSTSSQTESSQASSSESTPSSESAESTETPAEEVPYTGGPLEEGEAAYPINEVQIGPSGTQYENFSVKSTCQTQIDIGAELAKRPDVNIQKNGEPEVLIMHTHTCEAYLDIDTGQYPESFYPRTTDERYSVVAVGDVITQTLNNAGIGTIHDKTIHDNPSYNGSYYRSEQTVKDDLEKYPGIQVVLDIHRDALGNNETGKTKPTFVVNGKKAAQIMIIAGCDDDGTWEFPDWEYNLRLALQIQQTAETMYPGMTRPLSFCPSQYNMHLTHGSLLIEVGTDANTIEEATYTGELLGNVLASVLNQLQEQA